MRRLEAGRSSVLKCQIFSASTTRCHMSGDPCGRALGDSLRVGSVPASESVRSAALKQLMGRVHHRSHQSVHGLAHTQRTTAWSRGGGGHTRSGCCSGSVNHGGNPRLWIDHNQAKMSLDGPARRSDVEASAEPAVKSPLRMARQPSCARLPVGRGRGQEAPRRVRGRDTSGRTAPVHAAQRGCRGHP